MARLERLLKILIPYGDIDRPDKLRNSPLIGRLDGHQNFCTADWYAQYQSAASARLGHKSKRLRVGAKNMKDIDSAKRYGIINGQHERIL